MILTRKEFAALATLIERMSAGAAQAQARTLLASALVVTVENFGSRLVVAKNRKPKK